MSNRIVAEQAKAYHFKYATTHRTEDGFEFVIVAKSRDELNQAWQMIAGPARFDDTKINRVQIKRA
jgi:hypothetical protein